MTADDRHDLVSAGIEAADIDSGPTTQPLVITDDAELLDACLRWCAAAGVTPAVTSDPVSASGRWRGAPFVLIGQDCLADVAASRPTRRPHVHVVCHEPEACWRDAVRVGAENVVTGAQDELSEELTAAAEGREEACVMAVIGGVGGTGASTLVAGTALEAERRGLAVLAVDLDHSGGGLDSLFGLEDDPGVRWPDLADTRGRLSGDALRRVLIRQGGLSLLSANRGDAAPVPVAAVESVLQAASRRFDVVIFDLPRWLGSAAHVVLTSATASVLVVPEEIRAIAAARAVQAQTSATAANSVVVARARRGGIGSAETSRLLGIPLVARFRDDRRIRTAVDHGEGPGRSRTLRRTAGQTLDQLGLGRQHQKRLRARNLKGATR